MFNRAKKMENISYFQQNAATELANVQNDLIDEIAVDIANSVRLIIWVAEFVDILSCNDNVKNVVIKVTDFYAKIVFDNSTFSVYLDNWRIATIMYERAYNRPNKDHVPEKDDKKGANRRTIRVLEKLKGKASDKPEYAIRFLEMKTFWIIRKSSSKRNPYKEGTELYGSVPSDCFVV